MFGDWDTQQLGPSVVVPDYPRGLPAALREFPAAPWLYTGALENLPRLVEQLAAERPLLGNPAAVLRRVRDPFWLAEQLAADGLRFAPVRRTLTDADLADKSWLDKPRRSSGGGRIFVQRVGGTARAGRFFQQFIAGAPHAGAFVAAEGRAVLIGVARQYVGPSAAPDDFRYAGSVGPIRLTAAERETYDQLGNSLARRAGLRGLFGVDTMHADDGIWALEVNPRYTASIEIHERALNLLALAAHVAACREARLPATWPIADTATLHAKRIWYADASFTISAQHFEFLRAWWTAGRIADVPRAGTAVAAGQPVLTLFASAPTPEACAEQFERDVRFFRERVCTGALVHG